MAAKNRSKKLPKNTLLLKPKFVSVRPLLACANVAATAYMFCALLLMACGGPASKPLRVATSANAQFAMEALVKNFEAETGIPCELIVASSGKLYAQIREGAPYHVFVSADMKYPERLYKAKLTTGPPSVYAKGQLVLWSKQAKDFCTLNALQSDALTRIAMANPRTAPYGYAALQVVHQQPQAEGLKAKLVYGESVSQTAQFVLSEAAEVAFLPRSLAAAETMQEVGYWQPIDTTWHTPILQGIVALTRDSTQLEKAQQLQAFVLQAAADGYFERSGYLRP